MTYYRVSCYGSRIDTIEFNRVTEHFGFLSDGSRRRLNSSWENYYQTRTSAVNAVYKRLAYQNKMAIEQQKHVEKELTDFITQENITGDESGRDA